MNKRIKPLTKTKALVIRLDEEQMQNLEKRAERENVGKATYARWFLFKDEDNKP